MPGDRRHHHLFEAVDMNGAKLEFTNTIHCRSHAHCKTCRMFNDGRSWRESLLKAFRLPGDLIDFECPEGRGWGREPRWRDRVMPPGEWLALLIKVATIGIKRLRPQGNRRA
jgi:hypothetical protein